MSSETSLEALWLGRALEGPREERDAACRALYEALRPRVWRVCLQLCGDRALAEDAMQNAFLAVFRNLKAFRGEAQLSTWTYRVAIREALALRARRPRGAEPVESAEQLPSDGAPPDAQADARQRAQRTQAAFLTLSADHQAVLTLFAIDGLKHRQIAEVLGLSEGAVWSRLHEARKALRARVAERDVSHQKEPKP